MPLTMPNWTHLLHCCVHGIIVSHTSLCITEDYAIRDIDAVILDFSTTL